MSFDIWTDGEPPPPPPGSNLTPVYYNGGIIGYDDGKPKGGFITPNLGSIGPALPGIVGQGILSGGSNPTNPEAVTPSLPTANPGAAPYSSYNLLPGAIRDPLSNTLGSLWIAAAGPKFIGDLAGAIPKPVTDILGGLGPILGSPGKPPGGSQVPAGAQSFRNPAGSSTNVNGPAQTYFTDNTLLVNSMVILGGVILFFIIRKKF